MRLCVSTLTLTHSEFGCFPKNIYILKIQTLDQFEDDGCDNCESFLQVAGQKGAVFKYTSGNYDGLA